MKSFQDTLREQLNESVIIEKKDNGLWDKCKSLFSIGQKTDSKTQTENKEDTMFSFAKMFSHIGLFSGDSPYVQAKKEMRQQNAENRKKLADEKKSAIEQLRISHMKATNSKTQMIAAARVRADIQRLQAAKTECDQVNKKYSDLLKNKSTEIPSPAEQEADDRRLKAAMNAATPEQRNMMQKMRDAIFEISHEKVDGKVISITDPERIKKRIEECPHLKDTITAMQNMAKCEDMNGVIKQIADPNSRLGKIAREDEDKCTYDTVQEEQAQNTIDEANKEAEKNTKDIENLSKLSKAKKDYIEKRDLFVQYYLDHPDISQDNLTNEQKELIKNTKLDSHPFSSQDFKITVKNGEGDKIANTRKYLEEHPEYGDPKDLKKLTDEQIEKIFNEPEAELKNLFNKTTPPESPSVPDEYMINEEVKKSWDDLGNTIEEVDKNTNSCNKIYTDQKNDAEKRASVAKKKLEQVQARVDAAQQRFEEIELSNSIEQAGITPIEIDGQTMTVKEYIDKQVNELTPGETLKKGKVGYEDEDGTFHEKPSSDSPDYKDYIEERNRHIMLQSPKEIDDNMTLCGQYTAKVEDGKTVFRDDKGKECTAEEYADARVYLKQAMNLKAKQAEFQKDLDVAMDNPENAKNEFIKNIIEHPEENKDFIKKFIDNRYPDAEEPTDPGENASEDEKRKYQQEKRKYERNQEEREKLQSDFEDIEADKHGEEVDDDEQKTDAQDNDIDADDNDTDTEMVDGKKKIVNPARVWHRRKKKNGGTTRSYYNKEGVGISAKDYQDKMARYKERLAKSKQSSEPLEPKENTQQESISFSELMRFDMILEKYGDNVTSDILNEYDIDEGKFWSWSKDKLHKARNKAKSLKERIKKMIHK